MCNRCRANATGQRTGGKSMLLSKLLGLHACKHTESCACDDCEQYRARNKYADTGVFLSQSPKTTE